MLKIPPNLGEKEEPQRGAASSLGDVLTEGAVLGGSGQRDDAGPGGPPPFEGEFPSPCFTLERALG